MTCISGRILDWIKGLANTDPVQKRRRGQVPSNEALETFSVQGTHVIPFSSIELATANFSVDQLIGSGGFGHVYRCKLLVGGTERICAVKRLAANSTQGTKEFQREIEVMMVCRHKGIVPLWACSMNRVERCLVYPLMPGGSLHQRLMGTGGPPLMWDARVRVAMQMLQAVLYLHTPLHSKPVVIHRDIKPANILLDENDAARLCDVGFSRLYEQPSLQVSTRVLGTPGYMSPEYARFSVCSTACDNYSLGVVFLQLLTSLPALQPEGTPIPPDLPSKARKAKKEKKLLSIVDSSIGPWPSEAISALWKVAMGLSRDDESERMEASEALEELEGLDLDTDPLVAQAEEAPLCVICMDAPRMVRLVPCMHKALCQTCGALEDITVCPLCRALITSRVPAREDEPSYIPV
jgi:serine/threonine protein kinase